MLMSKICVVNSDIKNVIGVSDPNVMFKGPGSLKNLPTQRCQLNYEIGIHNASCREKNKVDLI